MTTGIPDLENLMGRATIVVRPSFLDLYDLMMHTHSVVDAIADLADQPKDSEPGTVAADVRRIDEAINLLRAFADSLLFQQTQD